MAIATLSARNAMATYYGSNVGKFGALFTADPGTTGTVTGELTGGSPAYARIAGGWGAASASAITSAALAFNVASGNTVTFFGLCTSGTAGTADLQDRVSITSQNFASQGTYTITATYTQS